MVHPDLMRGDGWVRCAICGELHVKADLGQPWPKLAPDPDEPGKWWDVCVGECAKDAGLRCACSDDFELPEDGCPIHGYPHA